MEINGTYIPDKFLKMTDKELDLELEKWQAQVRAASEPYDPTTFHISAGVIGKIKLVIQERKKTK